MTKVHFEDGKIQKIEGSGHVSLSGEAKDLFFDGDDFLLSGDVSKIATINVHNASLDAKNAKTDKLLLSLYLSNSKAKNIDAGITMLMDNSSISNSNNRILIFNKENNIIDGIVSVTNDVTFNRNATLSITKDGVLKVPDRSALEFSKISSEGKIYDEKTHAYYDTNNNLLDPETYIDLFTLKNGDGDETFSFDGVTLTLNKGYKFNITGDKAIDIVNNATILKADITGTELKSITGDGSIKELILSTNANPVINNQIEHINPINLNLNTLQNSNGSFFSLDRTKLFLNKGYEFNLSGNKFLLIVNDAVILKAEISTVQIHEIIGSGSIKELHLSNRANLKLENNLEKAVIDDDTELFLPIKKSYKDTTFSINGILKVTDKNVLNNLDFSKISGDGRIFVEKENAYYNTDGYILNNANSFQTNIKEYNFATAKAAEKIKEQKEAYKNAYINAGEQQDENVELLNTQMVNNDGLV